MYRNLETKYEDCVAVETCKFQTHAHTVQEYIQTVKGTK